MSPLPQLGLAAEELGFWMSCDVPSLRPGPKRIGLYSNPPFSGANLLLVSGRVTIFEEGTFESTK